MRIREKLWLGEGVFHLVLACAVGTIGGLTNLCYQRGHELVKALAFRASGDPAQIAETLDAWQRVLPPTLGGLAAGLILYWGLRLAGPQRSSNLLEAVVAGDGRLPLRTALIKAFSSLVSISTGASIGREGLITQLSSTLASKAGQLAGWQPYRLRLLVACGVASGLAAAYNAPISGAVFAAQIVLGNFSMNLFGPLVLSSVVATIVSRSFFGLEPLYRMPDLGHCQLAYLPWFLLLGFLSGTLGAGFLKLLRYSERAFSRLLVPVYARMAVAGMVVGVIAIAFPQIWGNGSGTTNEMLHSKSFAIDLLIGLVLAKLLATVVTVGSGTVGGVFTPTLFLGAGLGSVFGILAHRAGSALELSTGAFALVGMGSVLAATTHSPLLAMIMVFEISLSHAVMPLVMLSCVVSTSVARRLHTESIYTEPLKRKGLTIAWEDDQIGSASQITVGDLMHAPVLPLAETATFREIANRFLTSSNNFLPVVDAQQRLQGMVALQDLKQFLATENDFVAVIACDVMRPPPTCLTPNQKLLAALPMLLASEQRNIPVVNSDKEFLLVGTVIRVEALGLLSEAIATNSITR